MCQTLLEQHIVLTMNQNLENISHVHVNPYFSQIPLTQMCSDMISFELIIVDTYVQ